MRGERRGTKKQNLVVAESCKFSKPEDSEFATIVQEMQHFVDVCDLLRTFIDFRQFVAYKDTPSFIR